MTGLQPISDLFGNERYMKAKDGKQVRFLDERSGLVKYFHDRAEDRHGARFNIAYIGMQLAHLKLPDLYYLKSVCEQETRRGVKWNKVFWGSLSLKRNKPI